MEVEYTRKSADPDYYIKWYNENKDKILSKKREKIICECGSNITKNDKYRHLVSKKHTNGLILINLKKQLDQQKSIVA